jgi:hypothetical protein
VSPVRGKVEVKKRETVTLRSGVAAGEATPSPTITWVVGKEQSK